MNAPHPDQITEILESINAGDPDALQRLYPIVYDQLRRMASARMAKHRGQTLQTTALVHEVYLRLLKDQQPLWQNRGHFFAIAGDAMRNILVESARRRASLKRGGDQQRITLNENLPAVSLDPVTFLVFDQALSRLHQQDPMMSRIVKLRCFAGLTVKETALALNISEPTVDRKWAAAKAWLQREIIRSKE